MFTKERNYDLNILRRMLIMPFLVLALLLMLSMKKVKAQTIFIWLRFAQLYEVICLFLVIMSNIDHHVYKNGEVLLIVEI